MRKFKKKSKNRCTCFLCDCSQAPELSNRAAAEINTFLEIVLLNFQSHYSQSIRRYYDKRSRQHINEEKPWLNADDNSF